ncbi:hypothetical protein FKW77_002957 [Venturia effusa]|uniref:WW domain-containing protein n=1 Tax=Venturia effusa TaxID=50376 RepID=A0A517L8X7_9PEZI|nr:hypothetical protein FKW77_002957 [Venturia effusa]
MPVINPGTGYRLGKKPAVSPFAGPGRSLRQITKDDGDSAHGNEASISRTAEDSSLLKCTTDRVTNNEPGTGARKSSVIKADIVSADLAPVKTAHGSRDHKMANSEPPVKVPIGTTPAKPTNGKNTTGEAATSTVLGPYEDIKTTIPRFGDVGLAPTHTPAPATQSATISPIIPAANAPVTSSKVEPPILPRGWRAWSQDGRCYYENLVTSQTQWEIPMASAMSDLVVPSQQYSAPGIDQATGVVPMLPNALPKNGSQIPFTAESARVLPFRTEAVNQDEEPHEDRLRIKREEYFLIDTNEAAEIPAGHVEALVESGLVDDFGRPIRSPGTSPYRIENTDNDYNYYNEGDEFRSYNDSSSGYSSRRW